MNSIVFQNQSAFVGTRSLLDGVVIANETIDFVKKEKQIVRVLPYDGKTVRQQRRYIKFLENAFVVSTILLIFTVAIVIAQAAVLIGV